MKGHLVHVHDLLPADRERMFQLLAAHFAQPTWEQFEYDLARKDWIIQVQDQHGDLCGFTSLKVWDQPCAGESRLAVYSGDTILAREAWNTAQMWTVWAAAVNQLRERRGQDRLHWFFATCAYRSYRFLPVMTTVFYPRFDRPTPAPVQKLMDAVADRLFGESYDAPRGIVTLNPNERLRGEHLEIPELRLLDPHVAYFHERAARRDMGECLFCVAEMAPSNLTAVGSRILSHSANLRVHVGGRSGRTRQQPAS